MENVFLTDKMEIKIADFGLSKVHKQINETTTTKLGTLPYMAPELLDKKPSTFPVDIWAVGVMTYCFLFGKKPFDSTVGNQI